MIEVTVDQIEGAEFYKDIRILEPDELVAGVGLHRIEEERSTPELLRAIKLMGLRKVGYDWNYRCSLYANYPISYFRFKITKVFLRMYWSSIRWLYDNARVFKAIPKSQPFSWTFFTPYVWYRQFLRCFGDKKK